jgi:hypothetical protein
MSGVRGSGHASSSLMAGELHDPESLWAGAAPFAGIEPIAEADPDAVAPAATFLVEPKWASLGGVEWVVSDRPSSQGLRLWFAASGEKGVACAFGRLDDPKAVARASCHRLDEAGGLRWPGGGLFVDAEQAKRLLLLDRPESRILSAETNEVLVKGVSASHGSYVGRDDSITLLGPHQLSMLLWRRTSDGRIEQHELDTSSKMKMFWDHRVWMDGEEDARLHAHRVGERLDAPGPELDLGELSGDVMGNSLEACRADGTLVVEARRDDAINGAFAMITSKGFVPARSVDIMQGHLSCRPDGASWTAVYFQSLDPYPHDVVVGQTRCSAAGCERFNARFPGIEPAPPTLNGTWTKSGGRRAAGDSADAIDLGDKTLLVWARADDKSAFGSRERLVSLWMRLAPMAELERAPAAMLIAPERAVHSRIRVFARNNAAIVILRRGADQVAAIRIDASGKASSIDLAVK